MSPKIDIDRAGRDSILSELNKNLFVIAGAGSGKTFMLVARMVAMVKSGIDVSKICAITFTKKAAAEFLSRFQKALKEESLNPKNSEEEQKRCKTALEKIDLCFTGTIDSFCNLVLSEYPNNAHIPSSSAVVDEDEFIDLCKKEYEKIANDVNSPIRKEFLDFNRLVRNGADTFSRSISDVIDVSHLNIVYPVPSVSLEDEVKALANKYESLITSDINLLLKLKSDVYQNDPQGRPNDQFNELAKNEKRLNEKWTVNNFVSIRRAIKKIFTEWFRFNDQPSTKFFDFFPVKPQHFRGPKSGESTKLNEYFNDVDKIIYKYCIHFLVKACNTIKTNLKEQGKLSFTEYLMTFRNMVIENMGKGMKLINHIRNKHSYFLIDESQDTSPAQTELFLYLTSQVEAHSLRDCQPEPGHIFIVGDPKQSIYGFRGADVNAYLGTKELFEHVYDPQYNQVVYLTRNFRSTNELKEYFNDKYIGKLSGNYEPIPIDPDKTPSSIAGSVLSGVYTSISFITAIRNLVGKHYIYDTKAGVKRLIEYKDIMLLTWSTTNHDRVMETLREYDIPFYCEGKFFINTSEIVETLYALYSYVADQSGQLYNLLSSPLFNVAPNELLGINSVDDMPNNAYKNFIKSLETLRSINNPVILLDDIINRLHLYSLINYTNMEYAMFVLEKMKEAYNSLAISDVKSGAEFLKDFLSTKLERCMNLEEVPNAINLANVHKIKGLEKPVVILVECVTNPKGNTNDSNYMNNEAYVFRTGEVKFGHNSVYDIDCGDLFTAQEEAAKIKKAEEDERLGYVAVTRARNVLVIPDHIGGGKDPWKDVRIDNPKQIPYSDLPDINVEVAGEFNFEEPGSFNTDPTYQEKSPSAEAHISSKFVEEIVDEEKEEATEDIDRRTKGTIVHNLMQKIVNSKGKLPKEALITTILNEYSLGDNSPYKAILENVYNTMFSGGFSQNNGVSADLLPILFDSECQCEVPFSFLDGTEVWQGEIDLVYIHNGQYYIVDYKTNSSGEGLDEKYKKQLEAYKEVLKLSLGVDAITYIYHIDA